MIRTLDDFCAALEWATERYWLRWKIETQAIRTQTRSVIGMYSTCPIAAVCTVTENRFCNWTKARHALGMPEGLARDISVACDCNMNMLNEPQRNMRRQILNTLCAANARQKILLATIEKRK